VSFLILSEVDAAGCRNRAGGIKLYGLTALDDGAGAATGQRGDAERRGNAAGGDGHGYGARAGHVVAEVRDARAAACFVLVVDAESGGWAVWWSDGGVDYWGICTTRCRVENRQYG
jgi:hypothetical protein